MNTTTEMNRRSFIRRSGTVATAFAAPYFIPSGVLARDGKPGANDRIGIAVIGPGRQGSSLLGAAGNSPQARIVAIADVNLPRAKQMAAKYKAAVYKDYRELLERKDVDAVITATPEHWRAPKVIFRYANGTVMELANGPHGGGVFIGEKGTITIDRAKCVSTPPELASEALKKEIAAVNEQAKTLKNAVGDPTAPASPLAPEASAVTLPAMGGGHMQNWFDCIRSRQQPIADVEIGHRSATVCHLGNIARWTGLKLHWDPVKERFEEEDANQHLDRTRRKPYELPSSI